MKGKDISGERFGRLVAIELSQIRRRNRIQWRCVCDCGKECLVIYSNLTIGKTRSCGCINTERITKHGKCYSRIYRIWVGMKQRCLNPKYSRYFDYGGRGISICERWMDFNKFYEDVSTTYKDNLTLDRYPDVNGNYEPNNFRWATKLEQSTNTRKTKRINVNGVVKTISEWTLEMGYSRTLISTRLNRGFSETFAVMYPVQTKK